MTSNTPNGSGSADPGAAATPESIEADIARQREQLAETVDALSHKLDVKTQAKAQVSHAKERLTARATTPDGKPRPEVLAVGAAAVIAVVALIWWRRRR